MAEGRPLIAFAHIAGPGRSEPAATIILLPVCGVKHISEIVGDI
jgi:hypothetical protein